MRKLMPPVFAIALLVLGAPLQDASAQAHRSIVRQRSTSKGYLTYRPSGEQIAARAVGLANEFRQRAPRRDAKEMADLVFRMRAFYFVHVRGLGSKTDRSSLWDWKHEEYKAFVKAYSEASKELRKMRSSKIARGMSNTATALGLSYAERRARTYGVAGESARIKSALKQSAVRTKDSQRELAFVRDALGNIEKIAADLAEKRGIASQGLSANRYARLMREALFIFPKQGEAPSEKAREAALGVLIPMIRMIEQTGDMRRKAGMDEFTANGTREWLLKLRAELARAVTLSQMKAAAYWIADEASHQIRLHYYNG